VQQFSRNCVAFIALVLASVTARAAALTDAEQQAKDALKLALTNRYPNVDDWTLSKIGSHEKLSAESKVVSNIEVLHAGARSAVKVWFSDSSGVKRSQILWFVVQGQQSVFVAVRELGAGEIVDKTATVRALQDVVSSSCTAFELSADTTMRTRRRIEVGQAVCRENVEPLPAVSRGDTVLVRYASERITVVSKGIAHRDGVLGQRLRISSSDNRETFFAIVTAPREVTLYE
jgi:flagella basal body P-ring formation protein FlgA